MTKNLNSVICGFLFLTPALRMSIVHSCPSSIRFALLSKALSSLQSYSQCNSSQPSEDGLIIISGKSLFERLADLYTMWMDPSLFQTC